MNKKSIILLLVLLIAVTFCGCSSEPVYYTDKQMRNYVKNVYGNDVKFISMQTVHTGEDGRILDKYIYHYRTKDGINFEVYSYTYMTGMKGSYWWEKGRDSNYESAILKHYEQDIREKLCESDVVEVKFEDEVISIYVGDYRNIYNIADNIADVDKFISFNINGSKNSESAFKVYCDDTDGSRYEAAELKMSINKRDRLTKRKVVDLIETSLVNRVHIDNYYKQISVDLDDALLSKYKPTYMDVALNGNKTDIRLTYNEDFDTYTIGQLYFIRDNNEFEKMVLGLGGVYEREGRWDTYDETVYWTFGESEWIVEYSYDISESYSPKHGFTIYKDGEELELSDLEYTDSYDLYRKYTIGDLAKLLDAKVGIDYDDYVVNFKLK